MSSQTFDENLKNCECLTCIDFFQYCNELLADGYVRIFTWLNLELKYAAVVFRDPKKWELTDFFIITPVLKLNF